jgi:hypothetical protein
MAEESAIHSSIRVGIAERREYQERIVKTSLRENIFTFPALSDLSNVVAEQDEERQDA